MKRHRSTHEGIRELFSRWHDCGRFFLDDVMSGNFRERQASQSFSAKEIQFRRARTFLMITEMPLFQSS